MDYSMLGLPVLHRLPELAQTHVHWVGDITQPSHPLSSPSLPAFNPSQNQSLFQWVGSSHQVAKVLEFQFLHQSFHEYSALISFRIDWFDLLAVQGTLKSLLQYYSSRASVLWHSAFFMVQLSHSYTTLTFIHISHIHTHTVLTTWTLVGQVMALLFNTLSRFVIVFLPRSKHLLIWQLQSPSAGILEPKWMKSVTASIVFPIYFPWSDGTGCHDLCLLNVEF